MTASSILVSPKSGNATWQESNNLYRLLTDEFGKDTHVVIAPIPSASALHIECFAKNASAIFSRARELVRP